MERFDEDPDADEFPSEGARGFDPEDSSYEVPSHQSDFVSDEDTEPARGREDEYRALLSTIFYMTEDKKRLEQYCEKLLSRIDRLRRERPVEKLAEAWAMLGHEDRHAVASIMMDALEDNQGTDSLAELGGSLTALRLAQNKEAGSWPDQLDGMYDETLRAQEKVKAALLAVLEARDFKLRSLSKSALRSEDGDIDF